MAESEGLAPLLIVAKDLIACLEAQEVPGVVIGGVAASLLGRPRATRDLDVSVEVDDARWTEFLASFELHGFTAREEDAIAFARQTRVLLLRHAATGVDVDIVFAALPFEREAIARARSMTSEVGAIPLPSAEDLIIMKAVAHRPRDLTDIEAILDAHPEVDHRRILRWVRQFAAAMEQPEVLTDLQIMLRRGHRPRRQPPRNF